MNLKAHKIIGLLFGSVGILSFIMNFISTSSKIHRQQDIGFAWWNYPTLLFGCMMVALSIIPKESITFHFPRRKAKISLDVLSQRFQFFIMLLITTFSALENHQSQYMLPMVMIAGLMGIKYRIFANKGLVAFVLYFAAVIQYSAYADNMMMRGLFVILFAVFFFGISLIMFYDELGRYLALTKKYHTRLIEVEMKLGKMQGDTLDPAEMKFTPRETEVLKALCESRGSNQEIADKLGIKEQTVKSHIKNLFDKAGVDDRHQLIDLFRHAFVTD
jgi:DNA-binding CsgD family transcriptional regulator